MYLDSNTPSNNTVLGYFNGLHRPKSEVWRSLSKSVYLVQGPQPGEFLDIPPQFQSWGDVRTTRPAQDISSVEIFINS